jgi:hypothetical protein
MIERTITHGIDGQELCDEVFGAPGCSFKGPGFDSRYYVIL